MKHQQVLKLQSVHLTPRGSGLTFPLHSAALIHSTPKIAASKFVFRKPNLVHLFLHTELNTALIILLKELPSQEPPGDLQPMHIQC